MEEDQIILVDKPAGISSFGVVARVRRELKDQFGHKVKVGHTGTLDPFATGLLILLSGKMTKKSNEFLKHDKVYEATLKLGYTSTTGDSEGEIRLYPDEGCPEPGKARSSAGRPWQTAPWDAESPKGLWADRTRPESDAIESTIQSFVGEITQTPPKFSAIKINGERAYKLARKGEDFEVPSRKVTIYSIDILDYNYPELKIRAHVSSGTYIRTLAEDIGKALGTGAYLTALRRTKIADYNVKDARQITL
ncbi:tRNA pseudouridine(55) synthase TruB [Candidatus Saccharibacteria bacterium]|nr:tRNA pseudouridine(55) synthase TruB [Candidatus Saccharibacteria bacterium]